MALPGHSDINLTMKRYAHVLLPERASAMAKPPNLSKGGDEASASHVSLFSLYREPGP